MALVFFPLCGLAASTVQAAVTIMTPGVRAVEATAGTANPCCSIEQDHLQFSTALGEWDSSQSASSTAGATSAVQLISSIASNGNVGISATLSAAGTLSGGNLYYDSSGSIASYNVTGYGSSGVVFTVDVPTTVTLHGIFSFDGPTGGQTQLGLETGYYDSNGFTSTGNLVEEFYSPSSYNWAPGIPFDSTITLQPLASGGAYAFQWEAILDGATTSTSTMQYNAKMTFIGPSAVPASSSSGTIALAVLLMAAGAARMRRRASPGTDGSGSLVAPRRRVTGVRGSA